QPLLDRVHWVHAADILETACVVADTPGLYPVYLTSFLCSPDSMTIEYFKRILDERGKPYLILQLDDHDSTLGYETRVEAGVASFRNHMGRDAAKAAAAAAAHAGTQTGGAGEAGTQTAAGVLSVIPRTSARLDGRTLLFPVWDPLVNPLLAANLRREGIDARVLSEDPLVIRKSMRHNTGQCLPLNVIVQEAMDYVRGHGLVPSATSLWIPHSLLSCNFGMFPSYMKSVFEAEGMGGLQVYRGDMYYLDISLRATLNAYRAFLVGGLLRRVGCRLRPYEKVPGATDEAIRRAMQTLIPAFEGQGSKVQAYREAAAWFATVSVADAPRRPKVAVFGDIYVRDNDVMNQGLVHAIEAAGGEVLTTPYTEYVRIVAHAYFQKLLESGDRLKSLGYRALWKLVDTVGRDCRAPFEPYLDPEPAMDAAHNQELVQAFGLRTEHAGESFDNLLKIAHLASAYPDLELFVQASPSFCCPSLVTEAMARDIEKRTGVPVVSITYDGTGQYRNDSVVPFLKLARERGRASVPSASRAG
ncbi:MAG TPA: CoA activase, partial [Spirochaetia bacterium]|nr:CoA activase [Spirochaetia bacterium]